MTVQHLESPATQTPPPETPDLSPPSPPPSRQGKRKSCEEPSDPFTDPPCRGRDRVRACRASCSTEDPFTPVFTDDDDVEPPPGKGKGKETPEEEARWRKSLRERKLMLTLENSGSVARDHLASERTFLAYVRTSLTMSSAGVGLVQLFSLSASTAHKTDLEQFARPLGAVMIGIGLFTLGVGVVRYFLVQNALVRGVYPVARVSTTALSFFVLVMVIAVFIVILART
ncbi:uncharacterized protein TRAVEDRAFT_71689 [Trametes versicolor FP-101664 SS1]|uniref:uncharacterized protein n=1 Tax=Trametes versicolor (strain FP-101664) TaxID=717944 RepID=UPI0004623DF9|nr:uncharacterized protein TRAVEDRAFT_71689 [Trametes versicolor FP-101664 SS1]EIW59738.1 hypothetical protein TRAVEDRAFT_71689 [Trametes versicolor FP-101664 SS1]